MESFFEISMEKDIAAILNILPGAGSVTVIGPD